MINLLPLKEKKNIQTEKKYRLVLILATIFLMFLISLSLILLFVKIYISEQVECQRILTNLEQKKFAASEVQNLEKEIDLINQTFQQLNSFYQSQTQYTQLLEKISFIVPEEIYLTSLSLDKFQVSLAGYSPNRDSLFNFKKVLEEEAAFEEVYFPPSNWINPSNFIITFNINL